MRVQWEILLFFFIMDLSVGLVIALSLPGTEYVNPAYAGKSAEDYEEHFNGTQIMRSWSATPFSGIPLIGDIFAGASFTWQFFGYMMDGVPTFLTWMKDSFISDEAGRLAFDVIVTALRALKAFLIAMFAIEFISGRNVSD